MTAKAAPKSLFDPVVQADLKARLAHLRPDAARQWGTMTPAQAMAHCAVGLDLAAGRARPPMLFVGRVIGWMVKPMVLRDDQPMRRNSPTAPVLIVADAREFAREQERLAAAIDGFVAAGPAGCTDHPHSFFGRLKPDEWAVLMHKHIDHHLRQFSV